MAGGISAPRLVDLELAYAPPFGSAKDPINMAGFINDNSPARVAALAADEYAARFDGTYPTSWEALTPEQQAAAGLDDEDPTPDNEDEDHTQP